MPQILEFTEEQAASVVRQKTRISKTIETNDVDAVTGEIVRSSKSTTKVGGGEPDFVKLYYRTMLTFMQVDNVPVDMLLAISANIGWSNDGEPMVFKNDRITKERICERLNIKASMYTKYIKRCADKGLLIPVKGYRGVYEVNPFFIARGKWDSIQQLRGRYNFKNGEWEVRLTRDAAEDEAEEPFLVTDTARGSVTGISGQMALSADGTLYQEGPAYGEAPN